MQVNTPVILRIDNEVAIQLIDNEATSSNGKHVDIKLKFLHDNSAECKMQTEFIDTRIILADSIKKLSLSTSRPRIVQTNCGEKRVGGYRYLL